MVFPMAVMMTFTPMSTMAFTPRMVSTPRIGEVPAVRSGHGMVCMLCLLPLSVVAVPQQIVIHDPAHRQSEHEHKLIGQSGINLQHRAHDPRDQQRCPIDHISPQQTVAKCISLRSIGISPGMVVVRGPGHGEDKVLIEEMLPNHRGEIGNAVRDTEAVPHDKHREGEPVPNHKVEAQKQDIKEHRGDDRARHEKVLFLHLEGLFVQLLLPLLEAVARRHHKLKRHAHHFKAEGIRPLQHSKQPPHLGLLQSLFAPRVHGTRIRRTVAHLA